MDVTDDRDGRLYMHNIALFHQQLFRFGAYCLDDGVGEQLLAIQARDAFVQVDAGLGTN